jgi:hypothetical protein
MVLVPGFCLNGTGTYGTEPANWSTYSLSYYRDNNIMMIIDAMLSELMGGFYTSLDQSPTLSYVVGANEDSLFFNNLLWDPYAAINGTIIDSTRLNTAFGKFSASDAARPAFNITQDLLNEYLLNMTTLIMTAYGDGTLL